MSIGTVQLHSASVVAYSIEVRGCAQLPGFPVLFLTKAGNLARALDLCSAVGRVENC